MDSNSLNQRLSRINTLWSLLERANVGSMQSASTAQHLLMQRYCGAVYHYLLGALRDEEAAKEMFQDFALRFLQGKFHRADPAKGRFRDYVKRALSNLVSDYHRARRDHQPLPDNLADPAQPPGTEADNSLWLDNWREELLSRTWAALAEAQPTAYAALVSRVQNPEFPYADIAERLTAQMKKPFNANRARVSIFRARDKFAALLLEEVERSLEAPNEDDLVQELRDLRLLTYCEAALKRRRNDDCSENRPLI